MEREKRIREGVIIILIALIVFVGARYTSLVIYKPGQEMNGTLNLSVNRFVLDNATIELSLDDQKSSLNLNELISQELVLDENNQTGYNITTLELDLSKFKLIAPVLEGKYDLYVKIIENGLSVYETIEIIKVKEDKIEVNVSNHAPIFKEIPDQVWDKNNKHVLDLNDYVNDEDNDSLIIGNTFVENIKISIDNYSVELVPDNDFIGTREIWFSANDSETIIYSYKVLLNVSGVSEEINVSNITINNISNFTIENITEINLTNKTLETINVTNITTQSISEKRLVKRPFSIGLINIQTSTTTCLDNNTLLFDEVSERFYEEKEITELLPKCVIPDPTPSSDPEAWNLLYNITCILEKCNTFVMFDINSGAIEVLQNKTK